MLASKSVCHGTASAPPGSLSRDFDLLPEPFQADFADDDLFADHVARRAVDAHGLRAKCFFGLIGFSRMSAQALHRPKPRFRPKLQSTPPPGSITPETCGPSFCSNAGFQGSSSKPNPLSIIANRPEARDKRWR